MHQPLSTGAQQEESGGKRLRKLGPAKRREADPAPTENRAGAVSDGALDFQISCHKIPAEHYEHSHHVCPR